VSLLLQVKPDQAESHAKPLVFFKLAFRWPWHW
jgi:hypothetical protein